MVSDGVRRFAAVALSLGLGASCQARAAQTRSETSVPQVAAKALGIVSGIHGHWSQMPTNLVSSRMTGGALLGNGSVGIAYGGTTDKQEFYLGRDDFWSIQRGMMMPVGRIELSVPALRGGTVSLDENIGSANLTGDFAAGSAHLKSRAWVASSKNYFFIELRNAGSFGLDVAAEMLDDFGRNDSDTLGGMTKQVMWRRVSPEVVPATIGGPNDGKPANLEASVRSLDVFGDSSAAGATLARRTALYTCAPPADSTAEVDGHLHQPFACGNIILPERRFTVHAAINLAHTGGEGVVFSALGERWRMQQVEPTNPLGNVRGHDTGRPQGAEAGLLIFLSGGRLAANLNGTTVTADRPLTPGQWTDIAVTYDGTKLTLLIDGRSAGETSNFPTASQVMGPAWEWAATHPGDPAIPFADIAPQGILATRVVGVPSSSDGGKLRFTIPAGGKVIVAVAAMDDRDTPQYFQSAISGLEGTSVATVAADWTQHVNSWKSFWSRSFIEIPDETLQSWWYGSLYVLASCSKHGNVAPGLWGNWITTTRSGWQGDYTLDYNYEAPFWAAFPTNHVDLADPYDAPLLAWMARGRGLAKEVQAQGLVYYTHLAPSPGWSSDNFRALDQKSGALFAAVNCVQRWRYTRDPAYAREMWPFLTGVAEFWDHDLRLVKGRYVDMDDAAEEHLWGPASDVNPATVIAFLNMLYPALIDMSEQLGVNETDRTTWSEIASHLSPLPLAEANTVAAIRNAVGTTIPEGRMVMIETESGAPWVDISRGDRFSANPPVVIQGSSAGMNSLQAVFPAWNVGLESSSQLRQAAANTVDYTRLWYDSNNTSSFYPGAADAGFDPESILAHMHLMVTNMGYPSFAYKFPAGGVENEATVPTTIAAMLLQSYQQNIHVFANWPPHEDASFGDLLAVGDFLVSSRISRGFVQEVRITSQRGGPCHLANPWGPDQKVSVQIVGGSRKVIRGADLTVETRAEERLIFTPELRP